MMAGTRPATWCGVSGYVRKTESSCMNVDMCKNIRGSEKCAYGPQSMCERVRTCATGKEGVSVGGSVEE